MNELTSSPGSGPNALPTAADVFAELDALIDANRADPTPERAARLLDLRLRAAEMIDAGPTTRIDAPDEPFPTDGVPEVTLAELDAPQLARGLHHHGSLLVRGLLDDEQIGLLRDDLDAMIAGRASATEQKPSSIRETFLGGGGNRQASESPQVLAHLLDSLASSGLTAIVTEYLGARPVAIAERVRLRRSEQGLPWHQDAAFFGGTFGAVNAWVALTPCGVDRDGLAVVPRRVDEIVGGPSPTFTYGNDVYTTETVLQLLAGRAVARPVFEAGDALLFDEMTVHRTHVIRNPAGPRDVAVAWFFSPDRFPAREILEPWVKLVI